MNIKGIFFDDVAEFFDEISLSVLKDSGLTEKEFNKMLQKRFKSVVDGFDERLILHHIQYQKFSLNDFLTSHFNNQKTIVGQNTDPFTYFIIYISSSQTVFEKCCEAIKDAPTSRTDGILISLYGTIIRRSQQIVTLLIDGYIDAAMIIWRSMYENVIAFLTLLEQNDDTLTRKFIAHSLKGSKKKITSYTNTRKELKFKPLSKATYKKLEEEEKRITDLYGKNFIENEFGWADELVGPKQKASLRLLESKLKLQRYRPYYLLCSEQVHLGINTLNHYLEKGKIILPKIVAQETNNRSFLDPMQFTLSVLQEVNVKMLEKASTPHEYRINIKLLEKIFRIMLETFDLKKASGKKTNSS